MDLNFSAPNSTVYVSAVSNASYGQTVAIFPPGTTPPASPPATWPNNVAVFTGTGEGNVPMAPLQAGFLSNSANGGQLYFTPGTSSSGEYQIQIWATNGNNVTVESLESFSGSGDWGNGASANILTVVSEDAGNTGDGDYNDSVVLFTWYTPADPDAVRARRKAPGR